MTYCLGAVVLTLNATGSEFGLCRRRTWLTSCVNGPTWCPLLVVVASRERGAVETYVGSRAQVGGGPAIRKSCQYGGRVSSRQDEAGFVIGALTTDIALAVWW